MKYLLERGVKYAFVKDVDGITTYKYTKTPKLLYDWFGEKHSTLREVYSDVETALFGLTVDRESNRVVKVKRYIYPNDLLLINRKQIYGLES